jgi:hypothetical protein
LRRNIYIRHVQVFTQRAIALGQQTARGQRMKKEYGGGREREISRDRLNTCHTRVNKSRTHVNNPRFRPISFHQPPSHCSPHTTVALCVYYCPRTRHTPSGNCLCTHISGLSLSLFQSFLHVHMPTAGAYTPTIIAFSRSTNHTRAHPLRKSRIPITHSHRTWDFFHDWRPPLAAPPGTSEQRIYINSRHT